MLTMTEFTGNKSANKAILLSSIRQQHSESLFCSMLVCSGYVACADYPGGPGELISCRACVHRCKYLFMDSDGAGHTGR